MPTEDDKPWRRWPAERPSDRRLLLMRSAYEAYIGVAWCWLTVEGAGRVLAEYECPGEGWGCTAEELVVAEMYWRAYLCAAALP